MPFGAISVALDRSASSHPAIAAAATAMHDYISGGSPIDPRLSFAQLCDGFTRMLLTLGHDTGASVVVDDLQLLDHESLALLAVVLGRVEGDVSFVCATRSSGRDLDAHGAELLSRLKDWADVEELTLGPLGSNDVHQVLEQVFGREVGRPVSEIVQRRSGGNPLFVLEMARSLTQLDLIDDDLPSLTKSDTSRLHLTRHTAVLQRLFPLSPECRQVAQMVAVLDRVRLDDLQLIGDVVGADEAAVAAAFDELERRGILTVDSAGVWALFHPFVADALYDDIGPALRRRMHREVADTPRQPAVAGEPVDLNRLAWHTAESAVAGDVAAAQIMLDAAEAIRTTGPVSAAELCQRALDLISEPSPLRTELLSLRVRCLTLAARPQLAVEAGLAALAAMNAGPERARVADGVIAALFDAGRVGEARQLADREVTAGGASAFLLAQRAMLIAAEGDVAEAEAALTDVAATPVRSRGEEVLVQSFLASTHAALGRGR